MSGEDTGHEIYQEMWNLETLYAGEEVLIEYAVEIPRELLSLWDDVALQWAREVSKNPVVAYSAEREHRFWTNVNT